jgi:7-cyano-7-deazaguanine synthase in queuosine biosynthesis
MNIFGHIIIGAIQSVVCSSPMPLIGNILPDVVLIPNEIKNTIDGKKFDDNKVNSLIYNCYMFTHSMLFAVILGTYNIHLGIGIITHQIVDWFTHTNKFRTMPFYPFSKYQVGITINEKKALLISGGYDSVAILEMIDKKKYDYYFFDYGQSYSKEERNAITQVEKYYNIKIETIKKKWHTDIRNRNFLFINTLQELGYQTICTGSRNVLPLFDKYKDSNYVNLKLLAYVNRIVIETPLTFCTKKQIIKKIPKELITKLYSTEK